mgnify:CR=1 FL=1
MRSHLLEGKVRHRRSSPFVYELEHDVFYLALDTSELDRIGRMKLLGRNRWRTFTFRELGHILSHLPDEELPTADDPRSADRTACDTSAGIGRQRERKDIGGAKLAHEPLVEVRHRLAVHHGDGERLGRREAGTRSLKVTLEKGRVLRPDFAREVDRSHPTFSSAAGAAARQAASSWPRTSTK